MKSVLISGANQGFGKALFKLYSEKGWKVIPLVRSKKAAEELQEVNQECYPIVADLTDDDLIDRITEVLSAHCDSLDLIINNAGYTPLRSPTRIARNSTEGIR